MAARRALGNVLFGAFFLGIFLVTTTDALHFARAGHRWIVGDWLINYAGGFVRRGLIGELLQRAQMSWGLPATYLMAGAAIVAYGTILLGTFALCLRLRKEAWLVFFLVSPATFLFPVYSYDGGYRKDALFVAFLVLLVLASPGPPAHRALWFAASVVIPGCAVALVLSHEALFLYFPYLVAVVRFAFRHDASLRRTAVVLSVVAGAVAFVVSVRFHGDADTARTICTSVRAMVSNSDVCGGAIRAMASSAGDAYRLVVWRVQHEHYLRVYSMVALLSACPYVIYLASRAARLRDPAFLGVVVGVPLSAVLTSLPLFVFAGDWGRVIHLHLMGTL
ncbi:MAG TPA: hypothetical protein VMS64_37750, partial [Candidatus Methylomirabilis sp.]|nr:hypothetical protein [Candidatus Methylomirabilis sp.]